MAHILLGYEYSNSQAKLKYSKRKHFEVFFIPRFFFVRYQVEVQIFLFPNGKKSGKKSFVTSNKLRKVLSISLITRFKVFLVLSYIADKNSVYSFKKDLYKNKTTITAFNMKVFILLYNKF